jgi:hypothetical protein
MDIWFLVLGLAIAVVAFLGWIAPLVVGIVKLRRRRGGIVLTIIGAVWGLGALGMVGLGAFSYYQVSKFRHIEEFDPAAYHGEMGTIVVSHKGQGSLLLRERKADKQIRVAIDNGVAQAPAGEYEVVTYDAVAKDERGVKWTASCYYSKREPLSVAASSSQQLDAGPPFTAAVAVKERAKGKVSIDLGIAGRGGRQYSIMRQDGTAPGFEVLDKSGKVLWQGSFEYG